ncbi:MAG: hypothetical protein JNK58_00845 [Phycisphaerae bacterium]|nr:hypothetical protein [Phycisphaerae bacterium]
MFWMMMGRGARWMMIVPCLVAGGEASALQPSNVLLVYNSRNAESLAVRDAYVTSRPGVLQFDLNDASMPAGSVTRAEYLARLRGPIRDFINGVGGGTDRSAQVMAIVTTRGLPARILSSAGGADEFLLNSRWSSVESELCLLQQDLEASGTAYLPNRFSGMVYNPYWRSTGAAIESYSRVGVKTPRAFEGVLIPPGPEQVWRVTGLTPGGMYLVCRLDSAATPGGRSAVQNVQSLIARSRDLVVDRCGVQALFDEYGAPPNGFDLDDGEVPPLFPDRADFENASAFMNGFGIPTTHDHGFNFVTGAELADASRPLVALGTYGENHSYNGWGENPPGDGAYVSSYNFHPAAVFIAYESWSGTSIYTGGAGRGGQQQCLDFIARGGSFTIGSVMEPYAFTLADMEDLMPSLLRDSLTFAEAAYIALPVLSWQFVPVGDPLARVTVVGPGPATRIQPIGCPGDADRSGAVTFADITEVLAWYGSECSGGSSRGDADGNGAVNFADVTAVLRWMGTACG